MQVQNLIDRENTTCSYTSNAYLVTGDWNTIEDVNTMVDVGRDPAVIAAIDRASTGVGKKRIAQVILTHEHYDHVSMLQQIRELYSPVVYGFSRHCPGVDHYLEDGDVLRCGDREFRVIWAPGHSSDSVCLYCAEEGVLFTGDNPISLEGREGGYSEAFLAAIDYMFKQNIRVIYPGHGHPRTPRSL
jgi:glyoxylase-like metal-dependent hydrolase (beta-lactamase superfamily II)